MTDEPPDSPRQWPDDRRQPYQRRHGRVNEGFYGPEQPQSSRDMASSRRISTRPRETPTSNRLRVRRTRCRSLVISGQTRPT